MNSRSIYISLFLIALAFVSFLLPRDVNALTVSPTRFELKGDKGDTLTENINLTNDRNIPQNFYLSFANFEAQGETGNPVFVEPKNGLGTWMSASSVVTLLPGESKIVPFTIKIPNNAEPGGHFAAIFWGTSPNTPGGGQVSIGAKIGTLVLLSVNGDVKEEAGLLSFNTLDNQFFYKTLPVSFEYRFKNDGGDRIKPQGKIIMRNTVFIPADKIDANPTEGNVLPGSTRKYSIDWLKYDRGVDYIQPTSFLGKFWSNVVYEWKNFALGFYFADLKLSYGLQEQKANKMLVFFVFPWELVIVMIIVLFVGFFGGRKLLRTYNRYIIKKAQAHMNMS